MRRRLKRKFEKKLKKWSRTWAEKAFASGKPKQALAAIGLSKLSKNVTMANRMVAAKLYVQVIRGLQTGVWRHHSRNPLLTDDQYYKRHFSNLQAYQEPLQDGGELHEHYYGKRVKRPKDRQWVPPIKRPLRVLILTGNPYFVVAPQEALQDQEIETQLIDTTDFFNALKKRNEVSGAELLKLNTALYALGSFQYSEKEFHEALEELAPDIINAINWCDIVLYDWATFGAIWFSRCLDWSKKLVVRCHSYEAFSHYPIFLNHARVDQMIFIAGHILDIYFTHPVDDPSVRDRSTVLQNIRPTETPIVQHKKDDRSFALGMMKYAPVGKDPVFVLQTLQVLLKHDRRWHLYLAGNGFPDIPAEKPYVEKFKNMLDMLGEAVRLDGFVTEKAEWFAKVGYIFSASVREGSHEAVAEGMAHGCVPIVRNWPMVAQFEGARQSYPEYEPIETPEEAAAQIIATHDEFEEASSRAMHLAQTRYFSQQAKDDFVDFILADVHC